MKKNAEGTFLWVALVYKMLQEVPRWDVSPTLTKFPHGLDPIYKRMIGQILDQKNSGNVEMCKRIIILTILARRPLHLKELGAMADLRTEFLENLSLLEELVQLCGSFLTIREDIVLLVHLSAKELFTKDNGSKSSSQAFNKKMARLHIGL